MKNIAFYRTHHSLHEGSCKVKSCVEKAAKEGISTLVMADRTLLSDAITHYRTCVGNGVNPVMGLLLSIYDEKEITDWQISCNKHVFASIKLVYDGLFEESINRSVVYPVFSSIESRFISCIKKKNSAIKQQTQVSTYKHAIEQLSVFCDIFSKETCINQSYVNEMSTQAKRNCADFIFGEKFCENQNSSHRFYELINISTADAFVCDFLNLKCMIDCNELKNAVNDILTLYPSVANKPISIDKFIKSTRTLLSKATKILDDSSVRSPDIEKVFNKLSKDSLFVCAAIKKRYSNKLKNHERIGIDETDAGNGEKIISALATIESAYSEYQYLILNRKFDLLDSSHSLIKKYASIMGIVRGQHYFSNYIEKNDSMYPDLLVFAKSQAGWENLIKLSSLAFLNGQHSGMITLDKEKRASSSFPKTTLCDLNKYSDGLVVVLGVENDPLWTAVKDGSDTTPIIDKYLSLFGADNVLVAIQHTQTVKDGYRKNVEDLVNSKLVDVASEHGLIAFAMNNAFFVDKSGYTSHDAKSAIILGELMQSKNRNIRFGRGSYLQTDLEMIDLYSETPVLLNNARKLTEHFCLTGDHLQIELDVPVLPDFPVPDGYDINSWILKLAMDGVEKKFGLRIKHKFNVSDASELDGVEKQEVIDLKSKYSERLHREIEIVKGMGFNGYFLIVAEFINWSKCNGVPVGHGRGSGAGSIIAWGLDITDVDPIRYNLLFERFLNPERVSMPDFDVDFGAGYHPDTGEFMTRDSVIRHVQDMYNHNDELFPSVGQIATHGLLSPKSSFKALCRTDAKNVPYSNTFAKLVGDDPSQQKIKCCLENEPLMQRVEREPYLHYLLDMGGRIEGLKQSSGIHAGGVVIAKGTMVDHTPIMIDVREPKKIIAQFDKYGVEEAGLVKFDFLGLFNLTIMEIAKKYIRERTGVAVDLCTLSYEDSKVFDLLKSGNSHGVFQVESEGMRKLLQAIMCEDMEELSALLALYRPGPIQSGMVDNFIARKHGREVVSYPDAKWQHKCLKPILEPTYGIILYQEQVMQIAQALAGYTLGGADMLRRAMGKKKPEEMAKQREVFEQGAIKNGVDGELAMKIFDLVEKFAGYGFNKSHSMAYAHITYQTAWLKTYYPTEYMSALLTSFVTDQDKLKPTLVDCKRNGIQVTQPSINDSNTDFRPIGDGIISFGLAGIKGIGEDKLNAIIAEREKNGRFKSILDIRIRCPKDFDTRVAEGLLYSGALDDLETFHDCSDKLRNIVDVMGGSLSSKEIEQSRGVVSNTVFSLGSVERRGKEISNEIMQVLEKFDAVGFDEHLQHNGILEEDDSYAVKAGGEMVRFVNCLISSGKETTPAWDLYVDIVSSLLDDRAKLIRDYKEYRDKVDTAKADIQKLEDEKMEKLRVDNQLASFDKRAYLLKDIGTIVGQTKPTLLVLQEHKNAIVAECDVEESVSTSDKKFISKCTSIASSIDYKRVEPFTDGFRLSRELTYLTYYITGHPFDVDDRRRTMGYEFENTPITYINVPSLVVESGIDDEDELLNAQNENRRIKQNTPETRVAGIIVESRKFKVKKDGRNQGREMCILKIDDSTATMTIVVLPDALDCCKRMTSNGSVFACEGQVFYDMFRDDGSISMLPNKIYNPNDVMEIVYKNERGGKRR